MVVKDHGTGDRARRILGLRTSRQVLPDLDSGDAAAEADAVARLHRRGVLIERQGSAPVFIPATAVVKASLAPGLAGKVVGAGGLLVIRWRLGGEQVDTGLRADDKTRYPDWVAALKGLVRT